MRCGRRYPRPEWVFLLGCLVYTMFCPIPSFASTPHLLKDVRMVYQNGQWHVVLTGSASMPYKVIKATDPVRVVVDLPNTLSKTAITSSVKENEVIRTIKTVQFGSQTQPLARVEIGLIKDTSYEIHQVQEKIWVSFGAAEPAPKDKPVKVEPAAEKKVETPKVETRVAKKATTLQTPQQKPKVSSPAAAKETLPPASKILAIEWSFLEKEINFDIVGDGRLDNYNAFVLTEPLRLVIDFFGVQATEVEKLMSLEGPWVKRIRVATHPKKVRVVFDLISTPQGKVPHQITLGKDRLKISFTPSRDPS